MTRNDEHTQDDRLRELFRQLRREDRRQTPPFPRLSWLREDPETRPVRIRRWAVAGSLAVVLTSVLAAIAVAPRLDRSAPRGGEAGGTLLRVRRYVPPPPSIERTPVAPKKLTRKVPVADAAPAPPQGTEASRPPLVAELHESRPRMGQLAAQLQANVPSVIDESGQQLTVQGRSYAEVLTLGPGGQDEGGDGDPNVHGVRSRDFRAVVGGVSNVGLHRSAAPGAPRGEPGGTESYAALEDNPFHSVADQPRSTFSVDVDTASYSNVRRFLTAGRRPPRDAVRVEELINYFDYEHPAPRGDDPFGVALEVADCPWNAAHRLARITLAARREQRSDYGGSNLVFLLDVSGSMEAPNKLPLVKQAMSLLADQLGGSDTVSIVVYAGASGLVLPPTPGSDRAAILDALSNLRAGGSTAGAAGLRLAYQTARDNFLESGVNRVILATDGDFNVGVTSHSELLDIIEQDARSGVFLTALGFGMGNFKDDRLEQLADRGNGNYAYIDDLAEARKVLVEEIGATLVTVAKDVKLQVEFNPREVGAYRLIGYENRLLAHRDFNDDTKDAGEVGAGHTVTVLYELVPPGGTGSAPEVDPLRYQSGGEPTEAAGNGELFSLKVRFKPPHGATSRLSSYAVRDDGLSLGAASDDFRFAAAVAAFGMRLRDIAAVGEFDWGAIEALAATGVGHDAHGHRARFLSLIGRARSATP